jgi:TRAP-type C4-dicarboxylate transport system permease large subunit
VHFIAFAVLCFLMYLGVLDRSTFITKIDWAFLVLLAAIIGLMATMQHLHIDRLLVEQLGLISELMREDFILFVLLFSLVILGVRLLIPLNSAILILATAAMPFAHQAGITPWLVGFIMLIIAETAFFAYQSPYIYFLRSLTQTISYSEARVQAFHALLIPCKLAAIYLSVPFWHHLGLL